MSPSRLAIPCALLLAAAARADIERTSSVPSQTHTAYVIPQDGADLKLYIEPDTGYAIVSSGVCDEENNDEVFWQPAGGHSFHIGTVFSSLEWVSVTGQYHQLAGGGGGGGTLPTYTGQVAAVDLDVDGLAEPIEESLGVWLAVNGTRKPVTIAAVQQRGPSQTQGVSWSSNTLSIWTSATGGSPDSGSNLTLSAASAHQYYAQGKAASASVRDAHIQAAYVSGGETTIDRVRLTVVGATTTPFAVMAEGACTNLSVTLAPNPPGTNITVQLACLGGTGEVRFLPSGSLSTTLTGSATLQLTGVTASSTASNMLLSVLLGEDALVSNRFSVIKVEIENTDPRDTDDIQVQHFTNSAGTFTYTAIPLQLYYTISPTNGWTPDSVELRIKNPEGTTVRTVALPASSGQQSTNWDGKTDGGEFVPYGSNYVVEIAAIAGATTCTATNGLTVYEIREGNCLYREIPLNEHAAILYQYDGGNTLVDLTNHNKYVVAEHPGAFEFPETNNYGGWTWIDDDGAYCPTTLTRADRKDILENSYWLVHTNIEYSSLVTVLNWKGTNRDGTFTDILELRCDGFTEVAYEEVPVRLYGTKNFWNIMDMGSGPGTSLYYHNNNDSPYVAQTPKRQRAQFDGNGTTNEKDALYKPK